VDSTEVVRVLFEDCRRLDTRCGVDLEDVRARVFLRHHQIHCTKVQTESSNTSNCGLFTLIPLFVIGERDVVDGEVPPVRVVANEFLVRRLFCFAVLALLLDSDDPPVHDMKAVLRCLLDVPCVQRGVGYLLIFWTNHHDTITT
jgi:hypothetical protein